MIKLGKIFYFINHRCFAKNNRGVGVVLFGVIPGDRIRFPFKKYKKKSYIHSA